MFKRPVLIFSITQLIVFYSYAQHTIYPDGRPSANYRIACTDAGVVLRHGDGPDSCDTYGAREAILNKVGRTYYLFYDGAGKTGWLASLAVSSDLQHWKKKGKLLELGTPGSPDSKSASAPWVIRDKNTWHMFYLGTPNATPAPDRVPAFPYLTMKARSKSIEGPWTKQYDVKPFAEKPHSFYTITSSPGHIIKYKGKFLQFFSGATQDEQGTRRTLGLAITSNLDSTWTINDQPLFSLAEQVENSSVYFDQASKTWYLFTNHIGLTAGKGEYTDAIWMFWSKDVMHWDPEHSAVVLDKSNCTWAKGAIGMPTVIRTGNKLALMYDATPGESTSHMGRDIGLAWIQLPIKPVKIH